MGKDAGVTDSFSRYVIDIACDSHLFASWLCLFAPYVVFQDMPKNLPRRAER